MGRTFQVTYKVNEYARKMGKMLALNPFHDYGVSLNWSHSIERGRDRESESVEPGVGRFNC